MSSQPWWKEALRDIIGGTLGGIAGKLIDHPFDTIKVRLQSDSLGAGGAGRFRGPWDCLRQTVLQDGPRALFAGMSVPLAGSVFETVIMFTANGLFRRALVGGGQLQEGAPMPLPAVFGAGVGSGFFVALVLTPAELVKCRLQVQSSAAGPALSAGLPLPPSQPHYRGPIDCVVKSMRADGAGVLFRGHVATMLREMPGTGVWFTVYEAVVRWGAGGDRSSSSGGAQPPLPPSPPLVIGAGALAGCAYWLAIYPIDTVKTAQQTAAGGAGAASFRATLAAIYSAGGLRGLYAGLWPTLLRSAPSNAAVFLLYEQAVRAMRSAGLGDDE